MKRAFTNFLVDGVIAAAFLVTAVSGVLFLLPKSWVVGTSAGTPTMLGFATAGWLTIHDWSGIVMMAGVLLHCALHWRWIVHMTRRTFGREAARRGRSVRAPAPRTSARQPLAPQPAPAQAAVAASRRTPDDGPARYTRAGFLKGAALVCGGLVVGGAVTRGLAATASGSTATASKTGTTATSQATAQTDGGTSGTAQSASGTQAATGSGATTATTVARVTVDGNACIGCGRCLGVCPQGVFAESGGRATAADPAACVLCRRCLRVCPANAITLSA